MELVPIAKIGADILGPLVGLCQQDAPGVMFVNSAAQLFEDGVSLG
jgi:hypothetical protein